MDSSKVRVRPPEQMPAEIWSPGKVQSMLMDCKNVCFRIVC